MAREFDALAFRTTTNIKDYSSNIVCIFFNVFLFTSTAFSKSAMKLSNFPLRLELIPLLFCLLPLKVMKIQSMLWNCCHLDFFPTLLSLNAMLKSDSNLLFFLTCASLLSAHNISHVGKNYPWLSKKFLIHTFPTKKPWIS